MNNDLLKKGSSSRGMSSKMKYQVNKIIENNNRNHAIRKKEISDGTRKNRKSTIMQSFDYLYNVGVRLKNPQNFKPKHMMILVDYWFSKNLDPSTIKNKISYMNTFCTWINKVGMLNSMEELTDIKARCKRTGIAKSDKGWSAQGIDVLDKIAEVTQYDSHIGMQLMLQYVFYLRPREAWLLRPLVADNEEELKVWWGTKNRRKRTVLIKTDLQREVLEDAKKMVNPVTGSMVPQRFALEKWKSHFYYVMGKYGISRKNGVVPHGLRHEGANDLYEELTGSLSPVRAMETDHAQDPVDKEIDAKARETISAILGHARLQICNAYVGNYKKTPKKPTK